MKTEQVDLLQVRGPTLLLITFILLLFVCFFLFVSNGWFTFCRVASCVCLF